MLFVFYLAIGL